MAVALSQWHVCVRVRASASTREHTHTHTHAQRAGLWLTNADCPEEVDA